MKLLKPKHRGHDHDAENDGHGSRTLRAVVQGYNYSPKGDTEGILLQEGDRTVQVNVPPHLWIAIASTVPVGQSVELTVEAEPELRKHPDGEHPVYRLVSLRAPDGRVITVAGPGHEEEVTVEGVVTRLNYAKHGEANGVVLDGGDFLHLKPDGMKRVGLTVGQPIKAQGRARPIAFGGRAIEAEIVNGVSIGSKKPRH